SRRILIQRTSFTVEQLKTCGGDAAADSIPWPNGTSECSAGASPSQGTGCACADQPLGASPRLAEPDASAFRLILIPRTSFTVQQLKTCDGDAAADSIPCPNGTSECSAGASPSHKTVAAPKELDVPVQISRWALAHGWPNRTLARCG